MALRCGDCGLESDFEAAFGRQRRLLRRSLALCPRCLSGRRTRELRRGLACVGLLLGVGGALAGLADDRRGWAFLNLALLALFEGAALPLHEAGHAAVARAVGLRVVRVVLGQGRRLGSVRVAGVPVEWRLLPFGGLTFVVPEREHRIGLRLAATMLAGPAVNAVLLAVALIGAGGVPDGAGAWSALTTGPAPWLVLAAANALALVANLVPRTVASAVGPAGSDGLQILESLAAGPERERAWIVARYAAPALDAWQRGRLAEADREIAAGLARFPDEPTLQELLVAVRTDAGDAEGARELLLGLLRPDCEPDRRAVQLNNLAYVDFLLARDDLLDEAERCSDEAARIAPWLPPVQGTRGAVLVWAGRPREGLAWLERSLAGVERPTDRARVLCAMALGHAQGGDADAAKRCLERARASDPACPLLDRAARSLDAAPR